MRRAAIISGIIVLLAVFLLALRNREPAYQGKPASYWLRTLTQRTATNRNEAATAVRTLGTNITPILIQRLDATDSPWRSNVARAVKMQQVIRIPLPDSPAAQARREGLRGLEVLGSAAIPDLMKLLNDPRRSYDAAYLLSRLSNEVIPILIAMTTNGNVEVRRLAALDLGYRHTNAPGAVPALVDRLKTDSDRMTREIAATSIGSIPDLPDAALDALITLLDDSDTIAASNAARSLQMIGSRAKAAVPALAKLYLHSPMHRRVAGEALVTIDPATAAQYSIPPVWTNPYE